MSKRTMRRRCEELVARLDVPRPFDPEELCRRVGRLHGRTVRLAPLPMSSGAPCGLLASTETTDFVFYEPATSPLHQAHIIAHEIGHLLCDHGSVPAAGAEAARLLLPDLDPHLLRRMLGRSHYDAVEEQEAELIGSLLLWHASRADATPDRLPGAPDTGDLRRLQRTFDSSARRDADE